METLRANTKVCKVKECIEKCRYTTVKYSHVNAVGFRRGILIRCCFIPYFFFDQTRSWCACFGKGGNLEKQGHRNFDPQVLFDE